MTLWSAAVTRPSASTRARRLRPQGTPHSITCVIAIALLATAVHAQTLTLDQAVDLAMKNYPAIRASQAQVSVAEAGIDVARTAYLPRTDLLWQSNRATRNNVFGLLLPQSVIPGISGPVLGTKSWSDSVWGSAVGGLFSWEPFDFGSRRANVQAAQAERERTAAELALTRLDVATAAADAYLTVLAAQARVRAAQANVERMRVFGDAVRVLVQNQLRPGAEESRANAELAAARTVLIQAEQAEQIAGANLALAIGQAGTAPAVAPAPVAPPAALPPRTQNLTAHPSAIAQNAAVETFRARERALDRAWYPRFTLQSALSGRGTGALTDGRILGGANGLGPDVGNWAVGLTVTFPFLDFPLIRARKRAEQFRGQAESARYDQVVQNLTAQSDRARVLVESARRIAENTPLQLDAARTTETQARARFQAGLTNVVEVAEAQRLLAQAETEDALARLGVWRALLAAAAAGGDLDPFIRQFRAPGGP